MNAEAESRFLPGVAIAGTLVIVLLQCGSLATAGTSALWHMVQEGGVFMYALLFLYVLGAVGIGLLGATRLRGKSIPLPVFLAISALPLITGLAGARLGLSRAMNAIAHVEPSMRATLMAAGVAETITLGVMSTAVCASLLACVAFVIALEGPRARLKKRALIGTFAPPLLWVIVATAGLALGGILHPDAFQPWRVLSITFLIAAGASVCSGIGLGEPEEAATRPISAAIAIPAIGIAIAYLMAHNLRLIESMVTFAATAGADSSVKLTMLDRGLFEAAENFGVSVLTVLGPLAALLAVLAIGRASVSRAVSSHALSAALSALILVGIMGLGAMQHSTLMRTILGMGDAFRGTELPESNIRLPHVVDARTQSASGEGTIVMVNDQVEIDGELLGPRSVLLEPDRIRSSFEGRDLVLFTDGALTAGELYALLDAATREAIRVEVLVTTDEPTVELRGPFSGRPAPHPAIVFRYEPHQSYVGYAHVTNTDVRNLQRSDGDVGGWGEEVVTSDPDVPIARVLEVLGQYYDARFATPPVPDPEPNHEAGGVLGH